LILRGGAGAMKKPVKRGKARRPETQENSERGQKRANRFGEWPPVRERVISLGQKGRKNREGSGPLLGHAKNRGWTGQRKCRSL